MATQSQRLRKSYEMAKGPLLNPETYAAIAKLTPGTIAAEAMDLGVREHEPLLLAMDGMLSYAKAYQKAYNSRIGDDGVLGEHFAYVISGVRGLLNGNGAVAMARDISTDSKDNGVIESLYWTICEVAGLDGDSL